MRGLRQANRQEQEGIKTLAMSKKKIGRVGLRRGPTSVPSQEQIKAAQKKAVKDLWGTTEIQRNDSWRESEKDTGGNGTEHSRSGTESETEPPPQVTPMIADMLG
ncbi:hypothetical protein NDU88_003219 [Pleurodeles waltl]|uniref:Uncharacterized protein n=1 Tax=Pleurodeles waltl TaxID=8319 RepID=A0AAV7NG26_PLEWA|nr:hypothetical protein NDU88_003219 [Pleurodeles waltl]